MTDPTMPTTNQSATNGPVTAADIDALRRAGVLSARRYLPAVLMVRDRAFWNGWARRALLALGLGHLLAGIVFFFAYNWADLPAMAKFAIVDAGIAAAVLGALVLGLDRPAGRAALIAASVLVGVLLAVIGQVYQTGADAYDLFVAWTLLILPLVVAARDPAHTVVWIAVAYTAAATFGVQVLLAETDLHGAVLIAGLGWLLALALAVWEAAVRAVPRWRPRPWVRRTLFAAAGLHGLIAVVSVLVFREGGVTALVAGAALLIPFPLLFTGLLPDRPAFVLSACFAGLAAMAAGFRFVDALIWQGGTDKSMVLLGLAVLTAWCAATTVGLAMALRHVRPLGGST